MGLDPISLGLGAAKTVFGIGQALFGSGIKPQYTPYKVSENAQRKLGLASTLFNGRMAGGADAERNIYASGANAMGGISRNATDASQALALAAGVQGQQNDAFNKLGQQENANKMSLLENLNQAEDGMTAENDKVYKDRMMKYQVDSGARAEMMGGGFQNIFGGLSDIASFNMMDKMNKNRGGGLGSGLI